MIGDGAEQDAVAVLKLVLERGPVSSRAVAEALFGTGRVRTTERSNSMSHLRTMKQLGLLRADQVPVQPVGPTLVQNEYTVTPLGRDFLRLHDQAVGEPVPD